MESISSHLDQLHNQTVIVRTNFDVPFEAGQVLDTTRIEANLQTLLSLRRQHCPLILLSHQDRPDGVFKAEASLKPVIPLLEKLLHEPVSLSPYTSDYSKTQHSGTDPITLLENLRFWPEEEADDDQFSRYLASLGSAFVNEAFANCHRKHASIVGIPKFLPSYAGFTLTREIEILDSVKINPRKPLVVVLGGAKLETKEPLVNTFAPIANAILVGGKIALDLSRKSNLLPKNIILASLIPEGKDITESSAQRFSEIIRSAGTVIWNGTMGIAEDPDYISGTKIVAEAINQTPAFTLVGGGDTETALTKLNLESGIDHISSGGGAMLEYLANNSLPGTDCLRAR